jgi:endonuclease YncB( thermonuclease family)
MIGPASSNMSLRKPFHAVPMKLGARYRAKRRWACARRLVAPVPILVMAAAVGAAVGSHPAIDFRRPMRGASASNAYPEPLTGCRVVDGDTLRCGTERIRLLAIDAPEMPGHCRSGRACAPGDPYASTESLRVASYGALTIDRVSVDRYGRTLARVTGERGDLSCWQLSKRQAIYRSKWDDGFAVARTCPTAVL